MVIIGVDPDVAGHGIAIYRHRKLCWLARWKHEDVREFLDSEQEEVVFSIENVMANQSTWRAGKAASRAAAAKMGHSIGRLHHSQEVLLQLLEARDVPYILQRPASTWKKGAGIKQFQRVTGWQGRSNADTRSAAYFGFLVAQKEA